MWLCFLSRPEKISTFSLCFAKGSSAKGNSKSKPDSFGNQFFSQTPFGKKRQARRTGACTEGERVEAASASGEAVGSSLPMASSKGNPSIAPAAPRKKVLRGII